MKIILLDDQLMINKTHVEYFSYTSRKICSIQQAAA